MRKFEDILDWLKNFLLPSSNENFKVVVLCIFAAATFWVFNALNDNYSTRIDYPIAFVYPDSTHVVVEPLPKSIEIDVSGGGWNLLRRTFWFNIDPLKITLEQPENTSFVLASSLQSSVLDQLSDLKVNQILSDTLHVAIDREVEKVIRVVVDSSDISLENNHRIVSPLQLSSDSIILRGPERFIKIIPLIYTLQVENEKISSDYREKIKVPDFDSKLIKRKPEEIQLSFSVAKYINSSFKVRFEKVGFGTHQAQQWGLADSLAEVIITHRERMLDESQLDSLKLQLDFRKMNRSDSTIVPQIIYVPESLTKWEISLVPFKLIVNE